MSTGLCSRGVSRQSTLTERNMDEYVGARNDMTFAEFISTVVSSPLADVPSMRKRRSRRGDISQTRLILNILRRFMVELEHRWRPWFTRCSGKSVCDGND